MKENFSKNKVWQILGVAVLCAVTVLGAVLGVLFGMNHSSEDLNVSKDMSNQDPMIIETVEAKNISLMSGVATTAADGTVTKTVTATVTPANVVQYDKLVWGIAFKNESSAWANGKTVTDYVTISVSEDSLTCTVTCKQAFAEQVVIKVHDRLNCAYATLNVDYLKRIVSYKVEIVDEEGEKQILDSSNVQEQPAGIMFASKTSRVPSYTINLYFTFSDGSYEGVKHFVWNSRSGSETFSNGKTFQFDEQSEIEWEYDEFYLDLYYNNSKVGSWQILLNAPVSSVSLSDSSITF